MSGFRLAECAVSELALSGGRARLREKELRLECEAVGWVSLATGPPARLQTKVFRSFQGQT